LLKRYLVIGIFIIKGYCYAATVAGMLSTTPVWLSFAYFNAALNLYRALIYIIFNLSDLCKLGIKKQGKEK
jgi:hypothetical protein